MRFTAQDKSGTSIDVEAWFFGEAALEFARRKYGAGANIVKVCSTLRPGSTPGMIFNAFKPDGSLADDPIHVF